ncbi:MAG: SPOR domain-containing protein [Rhodocyclaceae bacterium]|nr:SPOR domain-containing protein [Rhodocyclaceae bacterium]
MLLGVLAILEPAPPPAAAPDTEAQAAQSGGPAAESAEAGSTGSASVVDTPREPLVGTAIALPGKEAKAIDAAVGDQQPAAPEARAEPDNAVVDPPQAHMPESEGSVPEKAAATPSDDVAGAAGDAADDGDGGAPVADVPPQDSRPPGGRLLLQLGVFSVERNAGALLARVRELGVPARLEARVVAGPFADRAAVDAARRQLRQAGIAEAIVVRER